jgi:hypothetical protein
MAHRHRRVGAPPARQAAFVPHRAIIEAWGRFWERSREPTDEAMKAAGIPTA